MSDKITKNKISAVIITKNEEKNIERCLNSIVNVVDEVILLDSNSTDSTVSLAESYEFVKVYSTEWKGYAETKNYGHSLANNEYILSIDADEALDEALQSSILDLKKNGLECAYSFNRITNYCGKWIRHGGWYPDVKIRIFNKNYGQWKGSHVHETLHVDQEVIYLKGHCLHFSINSIDEHVERANKYSSLAAQKLIANDKKGSMIKMIFGPLFKFFSMYLIKGGFKDGYYGDGIASISARSQAWREMKARQLYATHKEEKP